MANGTSCDDLVNVSTHLRPIKVLLEDVNGLVKTEMASQSTSMGLTDQEIPPWTPGNTQLVSLK